MTIGSAAHIYDEVGESIAVAFIKGISAGSSPRKTGHTMSMNLDFLRTVAVLCVFFAHLLQAFGWQNVGMIGMCGVVIFFVHSSLILMGFKLRVASAV